MTSVARKKFCIDTQTQSHTLTILFISAQNGTIQKNKVLLSVQTFVTLYSTTSLHRPTQIVLKYSMHKKFLCSKLHTRD